MAQNPAPTPQEQVDIQVAKLPLARSMFTHDSEASYIWVHPHILTLCWDGFGFGRDLGFVITLQMLMATSQIADATAFIDEAYGLKDDACFKDCGRIASSF